MLCSRRTCAPSPSRIVATVAFLLALTGCDRAPREAAPLRVGVLTPAADSVSGILIGARLGAEEAARSGQLLGRAIALLEAKAGEEGLAREAARLIDRGAIALIGGHDEGSCRTLDSIARARIVLYFNVGCRDDALRSTHAQTTFHVEGSDAMYRDAIAGARGAGGDVPLLWHPALERYGAAQLNQRFVRRTGTRADASAWGAWMAIKVLWEAALETRSGDATRIASHLRLASTEFDGHKGAALRFDSLSHQLLQPLMPAPRVAASTAMPDASWRDGSLSPVDLERLKTAVAERARLLLVSNEESSTVSVLRLPAGELLATFAFVARPRGIALSADGRELWVALSDERATEEGDEDGIVVIDLAAGRVTARHRAGSDPEQFAMHRDERGALLVAANEDAGSATLVDLQGRVAPTTLVVGIEPEGVALSPDGRWCYVTAETSNTVSVIDTRARRVVASFLVDERPRAVTFSRDGAFALVTNEISGTVTLIDARKHVVMRSASLHDGTARPVGVVFSPDGSRAYVANGHANSVSVLALPALEETATIAVGRRPWGIALSADGRTLYTANGASHDVSVIDVASARVVATHKAGVRPWGVAVTQ